MFFLVQIQIIHWVWFIILRKNLISALFLGLMYTVQSRKKPKTYQKIWVFGVNHMLSYGTCHKVNFPSARGPKMPFYSSLSSKCLFRTACATNWTVRAPVQQPYRIAQVSIQGTVPQSTKPFSKKSSLGLVHLLTNQSPLFAALYTVRRRKNLNSNEYSLIYRHIFCHIEGTSQQLKNVPSLNLTVLGRQDSIIL